MPGGPRHCRLISHRLFFVVLDDSDVHVNIPKNLSAPFMKGYQLMSLNKEIKLKMM